VPQFILAGAHELLKAAKEHATYAAYPGTTTIQRRLVSTYGKYCLVD